MSADMIPIIGIGVLIVFGIVLFMTNKSKKGKEVAKKATENISNIGNSISATISNKTEKKQPEKQSLQGAYVKSPNANVAKQDIFDFMEFEKIQDNMIISKKGEKYTAVIKCKGINYNLMSEVEQLSVEEGFINFLNTLKFPIQLYVQAQNIDLKENIKKFNNNMKGIEQEYSEVNSEYNLANNSLDTTDEELHSLEDKRDSLLNVMEYGQDIIKYVEKLAANKSMLQRNFYVLVSYYKSELTNAASFKKEELLDICYSELFTRVQNILSGLAMSSVTGTILNSNELAELLYSAYNRDDANYINIKQALESGFHRLFSVSEDAIMKKNKRLKETMRKEAEYKALVALEKAIEDGNVVTHNDIEDQYDEETSKMAIEMIKNENIPQSIKDKAKQEVISEYRKNKREKIKAREQERQKLIEKTQTARNEHDNDKVETDDNVVQTTDAVGNETAQLKNKQDVVDIESSENKIDLKNDDEESIV